MQYTDYINALRNANTPVRKKMEKKGTVKVGVVESTPIVWQDRLLRFEWVRSADWGDGHDDRKEGYYHFVDMETEEEVGVPFAHAHAFGCAYSEDGVMYAHGVRGNAGKTNIIDVYYSRDLIHWESKTAITLPEGMEVYNTSVCNDDDGYAMAIEVAGDKELLGGIYTIIFAKSKNLFDWEVLPIDRHIYLKERYAACPSIRYVDGFYYMIYLEICPLFRLFPYIVRTRDFETFEPGLINPFMVTDNDDKKVPHPERFTKEELDLIAISGDNNNSDVDLCEYNGKTVILYSWGNQLGREFLACAEYDGGLKEFLESFF